jgi:hypothetical protein
MGQIMGKLPSLAIYVAKSTLFEGSAFRASDQ